MPINYYCSIGMNGSNIEMNKNQLIQPVIENSVNQPGTPVQGQMYFDTTVGDKTMYFYNGTAWVEMDGSGSGVSSLVAGTGIGISAATGNVTVSNTGVLTVATTDSTFIDLTPNAATNGAVTVTAALSATGTPGGGNFLRGDNVWATPSGSYTSWTLGATTGANNDIIDGDDVDIVGTSGIATSIATAGSKSTVTVDLSDTAVTAATYINATITVDQQGRLTNALNGLVPVTSVTAGAGIVLTGAAKTPTVNVDYVGANNVIDSAGDGTTIVAADKILYEDATDSTVKEIAVSSLLALAPQGDITGLTDGNYIQIDDATGPVPTINALGTEASTPSRLVARDSSGFGYVDTPSSGDSSEKIATTAFVQASLTGLLEFKGGFNASTGAIVGGGNLTSGAARVAVAVGDYYVVTAPGNFFGNAATPLTTGDSVIVQTAAVAGASVEADFIIVQSDTDLATNTTPGIMFIDPSGSGITSNISGGKAILTNSDKGSAQNIFKNVASSSGTAVADNNNDTLTIVGSGSVSTAVAGDTLTITGTDTDTGVTSVSLTLGASVGVPLNATIVGRALNLTSRSYAGTTRVGFVPTGGSNSTFLRGDGTWVVPTNTNTQRGAGVGLSLNGNNLDANVDGVQSVAATNSSTTAARTYKVQVDSGDKLVVNVPWENTTASTFKATITSYQTLTHNLGSFDISVQLYDDTTKETIHACVDRLTTNTVAISGNDFPSTNIRVLCSLV